MSVLYTSLQMKLSQQLTDNIYMVMQNSTTSITVALESEDGQAIYASTGFASNSISWQKMNATLRANGTDYTARLALWLKVCRIFTSTSQDQTLPNLDRAAYCRSISSRTDTFGHHQKTCL